MLWTNGLYGHIRNNALKSALLLAGFVVLIGVYWWAGCLAVTAFRLTFAGELNGLADWDAFLAIGGRAWEIAWVRWYVPVTISAVWFVCASSFYHWAISAATGARAVSRRDEMALYNMVETLAISAGLPMPRIEVIETLELNAYAAGLTPANSTIAVTRGLLRSLDPDEIEAVLGHEMTHIKNRDVSLMVIALIFTGGITMLGDFVRSAWRGVGEEDAGNLIDPTPVLYLSGLVAAQFLFLMCFYFAIAMVVLQVAGMVIAITNLFAILSQLAISRTREFIADAGSVELTKDPDAMISALMRISHNDELPVAAEAMRGLMISRDCPDDEGFFDALFETHPSIGARVERLETFAGGHIVPRRRKADAGRTFAHPIHL